MCTISYSDIGSERTVCLALRDPTPHPLVVERRWDCPPNSIYIFNDGYILYDPERDNETEKA